eukprot:TRINITY_DN12104_c0_g1_i1.p1 TRINITY_DN12104_c0_g1~~TRINITY_DN12104_c0_g1_i1.p1  ORF type:complete len:1029 (+),score=265.52 TRINITY_DN12104_c0_g1_i1:71-3088(+)
MSRSGSGQLPRPVAEDTGAEPDSGTDPVLSRADTARCEPPGERTPVGAAGRPASRSPPGQLDPAPPEMSPMTAGVPPPVTPITPAGLFTERTGLREEPVSVLSAQTERAGWPPSWVVSARNVALGDHAEDRITRRPYPIANAWARFESQRYDSELPLRPPCPNDALRTSQPNFLGDWHRPAKSAEQAERLQQMATNFQSLDTRHPHSLSYRRYLARACWDAQEGLTRSGKQRCCAYGCHFQKWVTFTVIGALMGITGFCLFQTIEALSEMRTDLITDMVKHARSEGGGREQGLDAGAFFSWWAVSLGLVVAATCIAYWCPSSAGSGVPEVMAFLNGVHLRGVFNLRTFLAKWAGCALAVGCGLPVGPEGPMIHMGAIMGNIVGAGRSRQFHFSFNNCLDRVREPRDEIDYSTAGAAAGVSVAFSAPVGGLLFVSEEVSTHWRPTLAFAVFLCALVAHFFSALLMSQLEGWQLRSNSPTFGYFSLGALTLFPCDKGRVMHVIDIVPTIVLGVMGGVTGHLFTAANLALAKWRKRTYAKPRTRWLRLLEPALVTSLWCIVCFAIPFGLPCVTASKSQLDEPEQGRPELHWVHHPCDDPDTQVSPSASLFWQGGESVVKLLFGAKESLGEKFDYAALGAYFAVYFPFSCWACGLFISSGIVIPMLVTGGLMGRFVGVFLLDHFGGSQAPGTYAAIGAAAYFAGISRLTLSLVVIVMELTDETGYLICLMVAVTVARVVADFCGSHSLYHALMAMRNIPFIDRTELEEGLGRGGKLVCYRASEIMSPEVYCIKLRTTVREIALLLDRRYWPAHQRHQAFPVVDDENHFLGLIRRRQLHTVMLLAAEADWSDADGADRRGQFTWRQQLRLEDELFVHAGDDGIELCTPPALPTASYPRAVDLTEHVDTSQLTVGLACSVDTVHHLFMSMALRHLVVVDDQNRVSGVITRKELLPGMMAERAADGGATFRERAHTERPRLPAYPGKGASPSFCSKADSEWEFLGMLARPAS